MGDSLEIIDKSESFDSKKVVTLAVGGVLGTLVGLAAAYLLWKNAEKSGGDFEVSVGEGLSLSLLVMGLLRQVAKIGE
jgi:hypothetical protein